MKKGVEISFLLIIGFFYLLIVSELSLSTGKLLFAMRLLLYLVCFMISIYCMMILKNASVYRINQRASFIAHGFCMLNSILVLIIILTIYGYRTEMQNEYLCNWYYLFVIGQLSVIFASFFPITGKKHCFRKRVLMVLGKMAVWYIVGSSLHNYFKHSFIIFFLIIICIICVAITGYLNRNEFDPSEKNFYFTFLALIGEEMILVICLPYVVNSLMMITADFFMCFSYIALLVFVDATTNGILWKEIDLDLKNKEDEVLQGLNEKRRLEMASNMVENTINEMTQSISELEMKAVQELEGKALNYFHKIKENCERLSRINRNVAVMSQFESETSREDNDQFQKTNLSKLVFETVNSLEPYIQDKKLHIELKMGSDNIEAEVDPQRLERILINLISNAVKYNKPNGYIEVYLAEKKNMIFLSVKDTGVGISEDNIPTVFERFERVRDREKEEGSGLGLAIVKALVTKHQGEINIKSKVDVGTIISIKLPKNHM